MIISNLTSQLEKCYFTRKSSVINIELLDQRSEPLGFSLTIIIEIKISNVLLHVLTHVMNAFLHRK